MSKASDKFQIGQRVVLSARAVENGVHRFAKKSVRGTVVGFGRRSTLMVRVKRDEVTTAARTYHMDFWEAQP